MAEDRCWEHDWVYGPPPLYYCAHGKVVNGQVVVERNAAGNLAGD
jgi:hypothetical protein